MDMGIAMCHFELAANEAGVEGDWKVSQPDISSLSEEIEYVVSWECSDDFS